MKQMAYVSLLQAASKLNSPWKELGIPEDANDKTIKQAYRKLALK